MERFLAGLIAVVLLLNNSVFAEMRYVDSGMDEKSDAIAVSSGEEMRVKGTNSFGSMLAKSLTDEMDEQDSNDGCNVFSIEVNGKEATVSFETTQDAALVIGIYDEAGTAMLSSGTKEVSVGETETVISVDAEVMPAYFYLRGFLVDAETLRPLCTAYESPNYTKEMQDFFKKTIDDFDADKVLNLDEDKKNNFAVFSDKVKVISGAGIVVESADMDNNTYVFKNAHSIASLQHGDIFTYECEDGNILIVKVESISTNGDTVLVTGMDTSMEDVFEYVKIDTTSDMSDIIVDDSACADGVVYNGIVKDLEDKGHLNAVEGEDKISGFLSYTFLEEETAGISGNVSLKIGGSIKVYIDWTYQYIEAKIDYTVETNVKISVKEEKKMPLGFFGISPILGVYIEFTPSIVTKVSATVTIKGKLTGTTGLRASRDKGIEDISSKPYFEPELNGEFTIFVGLSMEPKIKIVSEHLASASLDASIGVEVKGTLKNPKPSSSKIHECKACVDGDVSAKAELKFKAKLLKSDKLAFGLDKSISVKILDWYFSFDYGEFGLTTCPHYLYKATITVEDWSKNPIKDAVVNAPFIMITKDENGVEKRTEVSSATTNDAGKVEGYLSGGTYNVSASAEGFDKGTKKITIYDDAKSVRIQLWKKISGSGGDKEDNKDDDITNPPINKPDDGESTLLKKNIQTLSFGWRHTGAITKDGSLYMWGNNDDGQLGDGTNIDQNKPVKVLDHIVTVSLGVDNSGAITEDGSLYMWGYNKSGQLGNETNNNQNKPVKVLEHVATVSLGMHRSGAITEDGSLYMWGAGLLEDGTNIDQSKPVKVLEHVVTVNIKQGFTAAITEDGSLYMWGNNDHGQLGDGTNNNQNKPVKVLEHVTTVSLGEDHSGAITEDGSLYMWGDNTSGQLGDGTYICQNKPMKVLEHVMTVSLGEDYSGAITEDGSLYMWGDGQYGKLGCERYMDQNKPVKVLEHVATVSLGEDHSGAITEDGSLYMWGYNKFGQLGNGKNFNVIKPVKVLEHVTVVNLGLDRSGAITEDENLYMWGYNASGQLGDGTTANKNRPVKVLDQIKLKKHLTDTNHLKSADIGRFSIRKLGDLEPSDIVENGKSQIASFINLRPNAVYNFYSTKDKHADNLLSASNLLFISQATADGNGGLSILYTPKESVSDTDVFLVKAEREDISSATVSISDLEYNHKMQYAEPVVTYQDRVLSEWEDYELLGDYSAIDAGEYALTVHGIGEYKGLINASYKINGVKSRKIQKITLSVANASLDSGKTLQLKVEILPADAENKTLLWSSSDEKVATVDRNGLVTAISEGNVTITVRSTDGSDISASCVITVKRKISYDPSGDNFNGGSSGGWNPSEGNSGNTENVPDKKPDDQIVVSLLYYIVEFDANGGTKLSRRTMTLLNDDNLGILPKVQRKNYIFSGWYTQKTGGTKVSSSTVLNAGTTLFARWRKVPKPSKVKISALKSSKPGQLAVNFGKVTGAKGYETVYSKNKKFPASSTKKAVSASVGTVLRKLKSGKKYYVRVRAYRLDSTGKKVYGSYSTVKSIKVK